MAFKKKKKAHRYRYREKIEDSQGTGGEDMSKWYQKVLKKIENQFHPSLNLGVFDLLYPTEYRKVNASAFVPLEHSPETKA